MACRNAASVVLPFDSEVGDAASVVTFDRGFLADTSFLSVESLLDSFLQAADKTSRKAVKTNALAEKFIFILNSLIFWK